MKRCPNCQRTYSDDAPSFCVNDGTQLVTEEAPAFDPQKTVLASTPQPPPQYSNPAPPPIANQPPPPPPPVQAAWPPPPPGQQQPQPPQGQNWGGGYYQPQPGQPPQQPQPYGAPYAPPVTGGKGLSLASFITGIVSFLAVTLIFLMSQRIIDTDRDVAEICFYGSAALGLIAIVLGVLALISRKQRNKWMAILGTVLGIPAILFFIYVWINYRL